MSFPYLCTVCKMSFNDKIDLDQHVPQHQTNTPQSINQFINVKMDIKTSHINVFNYCLNVLRDNEGLTGEKALRNLSYLLILKLIEPHFSGEINIDTYNYDFSHIEDELVEHHRKKLLEIVRFSNLAMEDESNLTNVLKYLWEDILAVHPTTKNIFLKGKYFDIQYKSSFKRIIDKLHSLDLSQSNYDAMGNAYEDVIQGSMTGKVLGQFFTQPLLKNMMVKLIDPQMHPDGKIETCGDPTMGTGGFLITYLQHVLKQAKTQNITPDWNFIKTEGLYGKEKEPDTFQLAALNMLISTGHMFENIELGDSIRVPITKKFDNILANPPFGIKGLKYDDFHTPLKSKYVPIKTDNAVSLFIQAIIYMLKIDGKCAVVLPDGQDLFSKTNTTLVAIREYLIKTCDLKEIIYLPSGMFTYTSIKTCVFYFVKKREGTDVLETKIKVSKTQKETGRDYKFSKTHQTTNVKFYDYNPYKDVKNLLVEVHIDKIASNSYSLNYNEYMKDETEEEQYEEGIVVKTLGEVCEFQNGSQLDKKDMVEGNIPIFGGGVKIVGFHNANNRNGNETIVCGTGYAGYVNHNYGNPFWASQCFTMKSKNINIMIDKYLYYYSKIILEPQFMSNQKGTAIPFIRYTQVIGVKIPIPSLECQQEIVKYLDFIYEKANKTSITKIEELKQLNEFCLSNQKIFGENENKKLGELCEFIKTGKNKPTDNKRGTLYPYYGTGSITGYTDQYLYDGYYILTARNGTIGNCFLTEGKFFPSDHIFVIDIKDKCLMKYVYYILSNNEKLDKLKTGVGIPNITKGTLENLIVPVPSLERQKEIVEYCEYNDTLIKQLEKEIENNKKQAKQFMEGIVKSRVQTEQQHDTTSVNTEPIDEVQTEIVSIEEEINIEPNPKVKKIVKKIKKKLVIVKDFPENKL